MTGRLSAPGEPSRRRVVVRCDGGEPGGTLFDALPDPAVRYAVCDGTPTVAAANRAYRERFGGEPAGEPLADRLGTDLAASSDGAAAGDEDPVGAATAAAADGDPHRTVVQVRRDGTPRDYLLRTVPTDGASGYVVLTDVTEQRDRIRALSAERDRLGEFASIVSHDLRNPLEVANVRLEAAERTGESVHFRKVETAHERMERIIEDVLTLARQGRVIDEVEAVDLGAVAREAWDSVAADGATLSVRTDAVVEADPKRLRELLGNLFRNAVVHVGDDVTVAVGDADGGFYVVDDGPGIDGEASKSVFEPGVSSRREGTGLGLSIVERIAEAHGWTVKLADGDDQLGGARFEFGGVTEPTA
ncbi:sensor histidine kinase [Halostella litorea]|uniref:sensor histidine kinase n=1 Tax=Halostella litorea TaxID=2528831 RepID=UPI00109201E1|nr:PAS domain-containing sensor histidine kinase [Halostella litorea]